MPQQFDFLDIITIMSLGLQMQEFITHNQGPDNKAIMEKLNEIETSLARLEENIDSVRKHLECEQ